MDFAVSQIISAVISLLGIIVTIIISNKAAQNNLIRRLENQDNIKDIKMDQLANEIQSTKTELAESLKSQHTIQEQFADQHTKMNATLEYFGKDMEILKADIKEHNNYAKQLPEIQGKLDLIAEKVEVSNKRISDLETFQHEITNRLINYKEK